MLRSDAALDGAAVPGICGNLYGEVWVHALSDEEKELPIAVLEAVGAFGNLDTFESEIDAADDTLLEVDASTTPDMLAASRSQSALMQLVHLRMQELPAYLRNEECITAAHMFGLTNAVTDAGSRGEIERLERLMKQLGLRLRYRDVSPRVPALLRELVNLMQRLRRCALKSETSSSMGDGPSRPRAPLALRLRGGAERAGPRLAAPPRGPPRTALESPAPPAPATGARLLPTPRPALAAEPRRLATQRPAVADTTGAAVGARLLPPPRPTMAAALRQPTAANATGTPAPSARPRPRQLPPPVCGGRLHAPQAPALTSRAPPPGDAGPWRRDRPQAPRREPAAAGSHEAQTALMRGTPAVLGSAAGDLMLLLQRDTSPYAIPADRLGLAGGIAADVFHTAEKAAPLGTVRANHSAWKHWLAWCAHLRISPWRSDTLANTGHDPAGHRREVLILAGALRFIYERMRPRRRSDVDPQPQSALNVLLAVRREHKTRGLIMAPLRLAGAVLRGLMREHIALHGPESLQPRRKEPFTPTILAKLVNVPNGLQLGHGLGTLEWHTTPGRALFALICTLSACGFRKAEVAQSSDTDHFIAMRGNLSFRIGGVVYLNPTAELLRKLTRGDIAILRPPPSKADQFGLIWASSPIYLGWGTEDRNACAALSAMILHLPLESSELAITPLFSRDGKDGFKAYQLDGALQRMLSSFMPAHIAAQYSWHSFRIYLACALLASGASTAQILALCRWLTEASLHIYARMSERSAVELVGSALQADFSTVRTTSIAARDLYQPDALLVRSGTRAPETINIDIDLGLGDHGDTSLRRLVDTLDTGENGE